ncbi:MAG TPA: methyltransferase domain-containing protein [Terriglobales bacterium]|nr:methyltransferase domain-containing protein [Terriglobales bacterium]
MTQLRDWDGAAYQKLSDPQFRWGMRVLERVALRGDETVLDVGCGTGRLTGELLERLPRGRVIAVDASESMLEEARKQLAKYGGRVELVAADALELKLNQVADLVFSTATFHWILDHAKLFRVLHRALRPGGRLEAQCGGGPNLHIVRSRAEDLRREPRFQPFFREWKNPWNYATPEETAERLRAAGFVEVETSLESTPTPFESADAYQQFTSKVVLRPYLAAITDETRRAEFLDELTRQAGAAEPPWTLDYWRLNMRGRKSK